MKKLFFILATILSVTVLLFTLSACSSGNKEEDHNNEAEKKAVSVAVDKSTIPVNAYAGQLSLSNISLIITYDNGEKESIPLKDEYISVAGKNLLAKPGTQIIDVIYQNFKCSFNIVLLDPSSIQYTLNIEGGVPIKVNGVAVEYQLSNNVFEARYDKGTVVVIEWVKIDGKVFGYWKANGEPVDNQERTSVTINANYHYQAFYDDYLFSVNFISFKEDMNIAQITAKTIESSTDIVSEMTMSDYVFMGWTERELSNKEALGGQISEDELVNFPYSIIANATFYAVWKPIGFSYRSTTIEYAGKKISGQEIIGYTGTLTNMEIPSKNVNGDIIAISKDAFSEENAKILTSLSIPASVYEIEEGTFRNCSSLQSFYVDPSSRNYSSVRGVLYEGDQTILVAYPAGKVASEYTMESTVTKIYSYAFYNAVLGGITLPSGVIDIGDYAFNSPHIDHVDFSDLKCDRIRSSFGIDENGKKKNQNVFSSYLTNICVENSEESAYKELLSDIKEKIITSDEALNRVYVENVDGIAILFRLIYGEYFDVVTKTAEIIGVGREVVNIQIPKNLIGTNTTYLVTSIGFYAFKDCSKLEKIELPTGLERVCDYAFDDTKWVKNLENSSIIFNETLYKYLGNSRVYTLDSTVKRIAQGAFAGNKQIRNIDITDNKVLERIDAYAFEGCTNLSSLAAGSSGNSLLIKTALNKIAPYAFSGTALVGIETDRDAQNAGGGLAEIGDYAFEKNYYLERVSLGMWALDDISPLAFYKCYALQEINIADGNAKYQSFNGIVYEKKGNNTYALFHYPAGQMREIFNPSKPAEDTTITVVSLGSYSLYYSNIGALELEESVEATIKTALYLPATVYVRFISDKTLHNSIYKDVFGNSQIEKFVFNENLSSEIILTFFGRDQELNDMLKTNVVPCEIFTDSGIMYAVYNEDTIKVIGADRTAAGRDLVIPETITYKNNAYDYKTVGKYSFYGYNLVNLTVNNVTEFENNALNGAYAIESLELMEEEVARIPKIYANSLGQRFNNELRVIVHCDPEENDNGYFKLWNGIIETFSYSDEQKVKHTAARKLFYGEPFMVLTYSDSDNVLHTASIQIGEVNATALADVGSKRAGYSIGKWVIEDKNGVKQNIDIKNGYAITENIVVECEWEPDVYKVFFEIDDTIELKFETQTDEVLGQYVEITFGSEYKFEVNNRINYEFDFNYWEIIGAESMNINKILPITGTWDRVIPGGIVTLKPGMSQKEYFIEYDLSDSDMIIPGGQTGKIVHYGENYKLDIPQKNGYEFIEWQMKVDNQYIRMTDEKGASCAEWLITAKSTVTFYPSWREKTIKVSLLFGENQVYGESSVVFNSSAYSIPMIIDDVPEDLLDLYGDKIEFFAGWADINEVIYVNAQGEGIKRWDKYENAVLYAVWPEFINNKDDLISAVSANNNVSVVLLDDIELDEPLLDTYSGVFNGNNHTITLVQTVGGETGIFGINNGTIKNATVSIKVTGSIDSVTTEELYVGGVCGVNNGTIENIIATADYEITVSDIQNKNLFIGCLIGLNNGTFSGRLRVKKFFINIETSEEFETLYCGTVCGANNGTINLIPTNEDVGLNIMNLSIKYAGEWYQGQIATIGSVVGDNAYGKTGTVRGSCRLYVKETYYNDYYFVDKTACFGGNSEGNNLAFNFNAIKLTEE